MEFAKFTLDGKVALITGASRGIGHAIAMGFANAGADVVVSSRNMEVLEKVAEEIRALGRKALPVAAHAGKLDQLDIIIDAVMKEFGRIDILVNNAATNPAWAFILDSDEKLWDSIVNLNLKGPFFLSQKVAKIMKEQGGGCIINISSVEGFLVGDRSAIYDITKAGMIHLTKVCAAEWAQYNIRVNTLAPGFTQTHLVRAMWDNPDYRNLLEKRIPLHRMAQPEDYAGTAVYLASDASRYATGSLVVVDGGLSLNI